LLAPRPTLNIQETVCEDVDWIHLAQDRDQCLALMNMVLNPLVP